MDLESLFAYNKAWAKPGEYTTKLSTSEEKQYQDWIDVLSTKLRPMNPDDPTYDMRGFFKLVKAGKASPPTEQGGHFPDTFKTPYHPTFSRESKYATENAPYWDGPVLKENTGSIAYGFLYAGEE